MYSKFLPSFFKNKLIDLYEISQLDKNERDIIVNDFIKSLLFLTILFLISIIIILFILSEARYPFLFLFYSK